MIATTTTSTAVSTIIAVISTTVIVFVVIAAAATTTTVILARAVIVVSTALILAPVSLVVVRMVRWRRCFVLTRVLLHLAFFVVLKIIEYRRLVLETVNDLQHLNALRIWHFLCVARVCHRFVFVVLQPNVAQVRVRYVLHVDPTHLERTLPFILRPDTRVGVVIDSGHHLRHAAEMARTVHGEEQIHRAALFLTLSECLVQALVAMLGRAPYLVLNTTMNIVFRIRFDHEESKT